jgi:hypothetical protein
MVGIPDNGESLNDVSVATANPGVETTLAVLA